MKVELRDYDIQVGDICLDINNDIFYIVKKYDFDLEKFKYLAINIVDDELYGGDEYNSLEELIEGYELTLLAKYDKIKLCKIKEDK